MLRALLLCSLSTIAAAADRLPGYAAEAASFTVSGLSSGGYMAVQFHVAHSSRVKGAGALALPALITARKGASGLPPIIA